MEYKIFINEERALREKLIKEFQKDRGDKETPFKYFPIDEKWRIPAKIDFRKPKVGINDYEIKFKKVGKVSFELQGNFHKFNLYQTEDDLTDGYYIYIKDGTSGTKTYGVGRFIRVVKGSDDQYYVDFNLSFTPACGHLDASACPWAQESSPVLIEAGEQNI
jgi:uncharacterized protein (DUF1684 family)